MLTELVLCVVFPRLGYGVAVGISIAISFIVGVAACIFIKGESINFFLAGRSLPMWMVAITLAAAAVDSNALLGNADLSYRYQFWDGAVLPIGLGLSLVLNGLFLAHHVNNDDVLTLPDIFAKRYGKIVEVLVSLCCICSFLFLLAGNLVGMGRIMSYTWSIDNKIAIWLSAAIIWGYTTAGGLYSVAYTDVLQGLIGWSGCLIVGIYMATSEDPQAPPPSIGFPLYTYPDNIGDGGICDSYQGVPCSVDPAKCCYNEALWCPSAENCTTDNAAYPIGDLRVFPDQMTDPSALTPFPNGLFWSWCTIFILGFGNLAALDFQSRCMAAISPNAARWGCFFAAAVTLLIGIPFAYLGAISR
jgi:Na+/proline symporter